MGLNECAGKSISPGKISADAGVSGAVVEPPSPGIPQRCQPWRDLVSAR